jgi:hypothetical protein
MYLSRGAFFKTGTYTKKNRRKQDPSESSGSFVALTDSHAKVRTSLGAGDLSLVGGDSADSGPYISLLDKQNYMTVIGSADLVTPSTGETHKTSAASVVLFGKDKNVLWSAP